MIYKVKHLPTGLYFQPHKHGGSNLSRKGKIYQTATHGLSSAMRDNNKDRPFRIYVEKDSVVHRLTKDVLTYTECKWAYKQLGADTNVTDWVIEEIKTI